MSNYIVLDYRYVSKMPNNLTFESAASLPYTSLLASEILLNHGKVNSNSNVRIFIWGGSSALEQILIQLAKRYVNTKQQISNTS